MTLVGIWENDYGSRMTLAACGTAITGIYESTTGSTGRYLVTGWQIDAAPREQAGQAVALAIGWRSIAEGQPDASWNWVSAMGGQITLMAGEDRLILSHLMVASRDFTGLAGRGIYSDKLVFHRVAGAPQPDDMAEPGIPDSADPLAGPWAAQDGTALAAIVTPDIGARLGHIGGTLTMGGRMLDISGFTDICAAPDGLAAQSVAIVARDAVRGVALALGGWVDRASGSLTLQRLTSRSTPVDCSYAQTDIWPLLFEKPSRT